MENGKSTVGKDGWESYNRTSSLVILKSEADIVKECITDMNWKINKTHELLLKNEEKRKMSGNNKKENYRYRAQDFNKRTTDF